MTARREIPSPLLALRALEVAPAGGGSRILAGVSLEIAEGETLCLVGESGCGKTVTALSIMGLLPPRELRVTGGSIRLAGEELTGAGARRLRALRARRMGLVFQEPMTALNPRMPVGRQIEEVLRAHTPLGRRERRARVLEMLERVRLADAERVSAAYPHQLSGGQRQRVTIAMALILHPRLLIADEPTSALDVMTQQEILKLLRELRADSFMGVLFITHDMGVVAELADRVAVMRRGRIVETGTVQEILSAPRTRHARELLDAVPSLMPRAPRMSAPGAIVLATRSLSKTYRDRSWLGRRREVAAVIDAGLALRRGRTLGLVGESGSGKSTLARCMLRLIEPCDGAIELAGVDIARLPQESLKPHRRKIQIVFQDPYRSLNPRRPVGESIIEGPVNFGMDRKGALARARKLLRLVGLPEDALRHYPHRFSGGQRQRIALARALALDPLVLVADEPVSALDMTTQAKVLRLLAGIQEETGIAILLVTHDLRVAAQLCDDVAIMRAGRIVEQGPTGRVLTKPRAAYTRLLCEAAPGRNWDFAGRHPAGGMRARA